MKKILVAGLMGAAALVASSAAMAHVDVSLGIGVPVYAAPPPVVYAPAPVAYGYGPAPVYGAVDYRGGYYRGGDGWRERQWRERRHEEWRGHDRGWHGDHR